MSHTYDIQCNNCYVYFCDCHPVYYIEDEPEIFCSEYCRDEYGDTVFGEPDEDKV